MSENANSSNDYITLSSLKHFFLAIFRIFFKFFDFLIRAVWKHIYVFLFCFIIGIFAGYIYYKQSDTYFKTEMIVSHNELTRKAYYEIIKNLNSLLQSQSHLNFASELKISQDLAKSVVSIEATGINDETLLSDTSTKMGQPFKIQVEASSNTSAAELQNPLLEYLNTNPYISLTKQSQKEIYLEKLQFIKQEQKKLDTLKSNYNLSMATMTMPATFYNNALNPSELYEHSLNLENEKEKILRWLNIQSRAILVVDSFKKPANPQSSSLIERLFIGLVVGVFTGVFLCTLLGINQVIKSKY